MNAVTTVHPDEVYAALRARGGRSQRLGNLQAVHEICRRHHGSGAHDFSVSTMSKLLEAAGVMKARALYNAPSADYRALIEAWGAYAGPPPTMPAKAKDREPATLDFILRIPDPAIRSIMQSVITERDKLRSRIATRKAAEGIVIDRRPLGAEIESAPGSQPIAAIAAVEQLTDSEKQTLLRAISPQFLEERGWKEAEHGEIVNIKTGRTVFDPGFATAIRKLLRS